MSISVTATLPDNADVTRVEITSQFIADILAELSAGDEMPAGISAISQRPDFLTVTFRGTPEIIGRIHRLCSAVTDVHVSPVSE